MAAEQHEGCCSASYEAEKQSESGEKHGR
jgi:hypothetical protein